MTKDAEEQRLKKAYKAIDERYHNINRLAGDTRKGQEALASLAPERDAALKA